MKDEAQPKAPKTNHMYNDRKVISCSPIFKCTLTSSCASHGPSSYVLHEDPVVADDIMDPLLDNCYYGERRSLIPELEYRLQHSEPIFKNDNAAVCMNVEDAARGKSVESDIKCFSRCKHELGAFQDVISNHASEVNHQEISKTWLDILQNIKWNGQHYTIESHVSKHRKAHYDLLECSTCIECAVLRPEQKFE